MAPVRSYPGQLVGLALAAIGICALVVIGLRLSPYPSLETAYYAHLDVGYLNYILPHETRAVTKVQSLQEHLLIDSFLVLVIGVLSGSGLARASGIATPNLHRGLGGSLGVLGIGIVALKFLSCHASLSMLLPACGLFVKEGLLDALHAVSFFGAGLVVGWSAWIFRAHSCRSTADRIAIRCTWLVAIGFFALGMEEVSWGQTYLGWETPQALAEINDQQETNLHNIFNGYLTPVYYLLGFGALVAVILGEQMARRWPNLLIVHLLAPRAELFWLAAALALSADIFVYSSTEASESVLAMLSLMYSARVLLTARAICAARMPATAVNIYPAVSFYTPAAGTLSNGSEM